MFRDITKIDHPLFLFARKMFWVFVFNIVFMLTLIPLITGPASLAACTAVFLDITDEKSKNWLKVYWCQFINRFGVSIFYGATAVIVAAIWYFDVSFFLHSDGIFRYVGLFVAGIGMLISAMFFQGIFVMIAKFHYGIADTCRAQLMFMKLQPLRCLLTFFMFLIFFGGSAAAVFLLKPLAFLVIFFFGIGFLVTAYGYNAIFYKYMDKEEELDFSDEELYSLDELCKRIERYMASSV